MFIFALFVIFMIVVILSQFDNDDNPYAKRLYFGILAILTLMVAFRPIGIDKDSLTYMEYYESVDVGVVELIEPTFDLISGFARMLDIPQMLFLVYALLAIPLKGYALSKLTPLWFLSLAVWMNNYFILHELTQIRTAVATSLFLFALIFLIKKDRWTYLGLTLVAVFFHYSALLLLPLALLGTKPLNFLWRIILIATPILCFAIYFMGIDPLTLIPLPFFQDKIELYEKLRDSGNAEPLNVFNLMVLFRLGSYYFILWKADEIYKNCKSIYLMLKVMCLSISVFAFFAYMPTLGSRASELYGVIDILILPTMIYAVKPEWVVKICLAVVCVGLFTMNIFVNNYLRFDV